MPGHPLQDSNAPHPSVRAMNGALLFGRVDGVAGGAALRRCGRGLHFGERKSGNNNGAGPAEPRSLPDSPHCELSQRCILPATKQKAPESILCFPAPFPYRQYSPLLGQRQGQRGIFGIAACPFALFVRILCNLEAYRPYSSRTKRSRAAKLRWTFSVSMQ